MPIPAETISKMQALPSDRMNIVINLVDQLSAMTPIDVFDSLCVSGSKDPMTEEEVDDFVAEVRKERSECSR